MNLFHNVILFTILLLAKGAGDDPTETRSNVEVVIEVETVEEEQTFIDTEPTGPVDEPELNEWDQSPALPYLNDANGWDDIKYYSTIRVLTLYHAIWLFTRGYDGMQVYNYNSSRNSWDIHSTLTDLADSNNWGGSRGYYSTIQLVVFSTGGNVWLLARNAEGLQLYLYDIVLDTWTQRQALVSLSDENGWNNEAYYSSIQAFGLSGKIWVFARDRTGEQIHQYDPDTDVWDTFPNLSALSDANRWGTDPSYYSTIQVVRLGAYFWLLGRGNDGMRLYQCETTSGRWTSKRTLVELSDENGWGDSEYYSTIQAVVLGANIWLFARNEFGVQTYQYDVRRDSWTQKQSLLALSDQNNWDRVEYYSTIQFVSLDDSIALLARGPNGLQYYEYTPVTDSWSLISTITALSDENNWDQREYYSTIKAIYYREGVNVISRGPGGASVYEYVG